MVLVKPIVAWRPCPGRTPAFDRNQPRVSAEEHGRAGLRDARLQTPGRVAPRAGNSARSSVTPCSRPLRVPCGRRCAPLTAATHGTPKSRRPGRRNGSPAEPRNAMRSVTRPPHSVSGPKRGFATAEFDLSQTFRSGERMVGAGRNQSDRFWAESLNSGPSHDWPTPVRSRPKLNFRLPSAAIRYPHRVR